jgi:hypothetical protein
MSESTKLMSFEEFRAAEAQPFGEAVRQQREFFRDAAAADAVLQPGAIRLAGWAEWPQHASHPSAG